MRKVLILLLIGATQIVSGQTGGKNSFSFLQIPNSARASSLGGSSISMMEDDPNLIRDNPSILDTHLDNHFSFNYINYLADVNAGDIQYAKRIKDVGAMSFGIQFLGYGTFERAEENGQRNGEFNAGDYTFNVGYGRSFDSVWSVGANLKFIYSNYDSYNRTALGLDLAGSYRSKDRSFVTALAIRNLGTTLSNNVSEVSENLPFEIQLGLSKKIPKAPLRFHLQLRDLQRFDLVTDDPNFEGRTNNRTKEVIRSPWSGENFMRHLVFAADIVPHQNFYLTIAYNHKRRRELAVNGRGASGISFGAGLKIKRIRFNYAYAGYLARGNSHHIGISTNFNEYFKKN